MYFIGTRSTETTTHTIHIYHGTHYYQHCLSNLSRAALVDQAWVDPVNQPIKSLLLVNGNEMSVQTSIFSNVWSQIKRII